MSYRDEQLKREYKDNQYGVAMADPVNNPEHYNTGDIECIDAIKASMSPEEFRGYLKGNTMKYMWRYTYKGKPVQDLNKAQWYLGRLTEEVENGA